MHKFRRALRFMPLLAAFVLLLIAGRTQAAPAAPIEALPLAAPSAEMMTMAAAVTSSGPTFFYVGSTQDVTGFQSAFSNEVTATFGQGQHNANLTWTAATVPTGGAAIAGYNIWRGTVSGGPYTKITTTLLPATAVAYTDTFVLPNALSGLAATVN